jgi:hypothetical protein
MKKIFLLVGVLISLITSCSRNNYIGNRMEKLPNDVVLKWNQVAYEAFGGVAIQHSLMASRINAMVSLAMHDALNAVYPKYATYAFAGSDTGADPIAAAASAAHTVLLHETPIAKVLSILLYSKHFRQSLMAMQRQEELNLGKKQDKQY